MSYNGSVDFWVADDGSPWRRARRTTIAEFPTDGPQSLVESR